MFAKKYINRLLRLKALLLADAKNQEGIKFNITTLINTSAPKENPVSCGTQACAMGLAALSGEFQPEGLGARFPTNYTKDSAWGSSLDITMNGRITYYENAAVRLFGIDKITTDWLFGPHSYYGTNHDGRGAEGERAVARRIARVVRTGKAPKSVYVNHNRD